MSSISRNFKSIGLYKPINQCFSADFYNILDKSPILPYSDNKSRYSHQNFYF